MSIFANLKHKLNEDFTKNIVTVLGGSTISMILPVLSSLWLVRIYDVATDFTPFALFISFCATLSAVANSHYTSAILVADTEQESVNIIWLTLIINGIIAVFVTIALFFLRMSVLKFLNASPSFYYTIWLVPFTVLLMGINAAFTQWAYRFKQFKRITVNRIMQAVILWFVKLPLDYFLKTYRG